MIALDDNDFFKGALKNPSNIRPNRLFTADSNIILYKVGTLKSDKLEEIIEKVIEIIKT